MKLFEKDSYVSPGSIGGKIKKYRELRGWSQAQLGKECGFPEATADVRIAQYEKNRRTPKGEALKNLADALGVSESAFLEVDLVPNLTMYHVLFDLEELHGLYPDQDEEGYVLRFGGPTVHNHENTSSDFQLFLKAWYEKKQKSLPDPSDSSEQVSKKERDYLLWKAGYPDNAARENEAKIRDALREKRLQAELDALYAKRNSESELQRIDKAIEEFILEVRENDSTLKSGSELISLIKWVKDRGLPIDRSSPEVIYEDDPEHSYIHLFSIKSEDITIDDNNKRLYARIVCAIESLHGHGIQIIRRITSRDKVLYVSYEYLSEQHRYFEDMDR